MNCHIITLFPKAFKSYLDTSILARAQKSKKIKLYFYNPRDFVRPAQKQKKKVKPYLRVDDKPYGGGPGMIIQALPVIKAVEKAKRKAQNAKIIWLSPAGKQFSNKTAEKYYKKCKDIIIICGRYEGVDARVKKIFKVDNISVGPYVLTGGELPAMVIMDTMTRRIPGVLGNIESVEENRISSPEVYTRPEVLEYKGKKYKVPKILLSGNHKKIENWRNKERKF